MEKKKYITKNPQKIKIKPLKYQKNSKIVKVAKKISKIGKTFLKNLCKKKKICLRKEKKNSEKREKKCFLLSFPILGGLNRPELSSQGGYPERDREGQTEILVSNIGSRIQETLSLLMGEDDSIVSKNLTKMSV